MGSNRDSEATLPLFSPNHWLCEQARDFACLGLSFPICIMDIMIAPITWSYQED